MSSTISCPFCGADLHRRTRWLNNMELFAGYEECGCDEAVRERDRAKAEEERKAKAEEDAARQRAYARAGLKPRFLRPLPAELVSVADRIEQTVRDGKAEGRGAYLCGTVGTGKTHVATEVGRRFVDSRWSVTMTGAMEILSRVTRTFSTDEAEDDVFSRLSRCDLLIIDELGKEPNGDWALPRMFRVINDRYEAMKPTVVTTQYPKKSELIARLSRNGDEETATAIVSRLAQTCATVPFTGMDRRLR